ncbi:HNH endonuclease [Tumebacillus lipolyticus]|uniref:HNH endonuclease n=1 Tax=Tumebacillus lipolyticus TaxID=1280370 RepID=A0ABW4ZUB7_9BACL
MDDRSAKRRQREELQAASKRNDFSAIVRKHVRERDQERCVLCGKPGREVHHIISRSQGGLGTADNGICLDASCHHLAHRSKRVASRLIEYRKRVLLPLYGLKSEQYIWLDALTDGRCRCGGEIIDGECAAGCGLKIGMEREEKNG